MKLLIDDAHIEKIKELYLYYPIDGVTTNPSILAKCGCAPYKILKEIRSFIGPEQELHVQVTAKTAEDMVEDARRIAEELGKQTFIKIPAVPEGFRAMKLLKPAGYFLTATAIYTPMQAYLAAKCGAHYAAPYINRIDNFGYDGVQVAKTIHTIFQNNSFHTKVLAASFKNSQQALSLCQFGIGAATVAPDVIAEFVKNPAIDSAIEAFLKDFDTLTGHLGKTMRDC